MEPLREAVDTLKEVLPNVVFGAELDEVEGGAGGGIGMEADPGSLNLSADPPVVSSLLPEGAPADAEQGSPQRAPIGWDAADPRPRASLVAPASSFGHTNAEVSAALQGGGAQGLLGPIVAAAAAAALAPLGWWLYHRILGARALEQATRSRVYHLIASEPGLRVGTMAARLAIDPKTASHHVRILEASGMVAGVGEGTSHKRYFTAGHAGPTETRAWTGALSNPATKAVYDHLAAAGATDLPTLQAALGLAPATVSTAVKRLRGVGLVEVARVHRRVVARAVAGPWTAPDSQPPEALPPAPPRVGLAAGGSQGSRILGTSA